MSIYDDGTYLDKHPGWHAERAAWKAGQVLKAFRALGLAPVSICDIGCGTGQILDLVAQQTESVTRGVGFEPSDDAPITRPGSPAVVIERADARTTPSRFDLAMMLDVFEHVEDYLGFLRSCAPLAPRFVFHIPLEISVLSVGANHLGVSRASIGHLHQFTHRTALDTVRQVGFEPIYSHYTPAAWDGPGRNPRTPLNVLRRAGFQLSPTLTQRFLGGMSTIVVADSPTKETGVPRSV